MLAINISTALMCSIGQKLHVVHCFEQHMRRYNLSPITHVHTQFQFVISYYIFDLLY